MIEKVIGVIASVIAIIGFLGFGYYTIRYLLKATNDQPYFEENKTMAVLKVIILFIFTIGFLIASIFTFKYCFTL